MLSNVKQNQNKKGREPRIVKPITVVEGLKTSIIINTLFCAHAHLKDMILCLEKYIYMYNKLVGGNGTT